MLLCYSSDGSFYNTYRHKVREMFYQYTTTTVLSTLVINIHRQTDILEQDESMFSALVTIARQHSVLKHGIFISPARDDFLGACVQLARS